MTSERIMLPIDSFALI